MKTDALKWCVDKMGYTAPDTCDTEAAQKAAAAYGELKALEDSHADITRALRRLLEAFPGAHATAEEWDATNDARNTLKKWITP